MRSFILTFFLLSAACLAQTPPATPAEEAQQLVGREFGPGITVDQKYTPMVADLDGDDQPDLVVVAQTKNPLANEGDYHYKTIDPYDSFFGWGNPRETVAFSATNALTTRYVLVLHNWKQPKAKFLIINLPFDQISIARLHLKKKKVVTALHIEDVGGLASDVYWDGKKYRWEPNALTQ